MKLKLLVLAATFSLQQNLMAQDVLAAPYHIVASSAADRFGYGGGSIHHYGLSLCPSGQAGGPGAALSGFGGLGLFTAGQNRLWVHLNGNVGVNTTSPQAPLDVNGNVRVTGLQISLNNATWYCDGGSSTFSHPFRTHITSGESIYLLPGPGQQVYVGGGANGAQDLVVTRNLSVAGQASVQTLALTSDRNVKQSFRPVDPGTILAKVIGLPLSTWAYTNAPNERHIGPMAQDFRGALGLGADDKHISAGDGIGVALAAIQGLNEKVESKEAEIAALKERLRAVTSELAQVTGDLVNRMARLEKAATGRPSGDEAAVSEAVGANAAR